jgi:hypothetical protein
MSLVSEPFKFSDELECTHRLEQLNSCLNSSSWACRVYVSAISDKAEFKRQNGSCGKFSRVQLRDRNSQIEMILFMPYCDRIQFTSLEINSCYCLRGGDVIVSKPSLRKWPDDQMSAGQKRRFKSIGYDIRVNKDTIIKKFPANLVEPEELSYVCRDATESEDEEAAASVDLSESLAIINHSPLPSNEAQNTSVCVKSSSVPLAAASTFNYPRRLLIKEIILKPTNSVITVLAILCELDEFDKTNVIKSKRFPERDINVRRVTIVDTSCVPLKVALWGTQAKNFNLPVGTCILLKDAVLSNYNRVSLSVQRNTVIMSFGEYSAHEGVSNQSKINKRVGVIEAERLEEPFFNELVNWWLSTGSKIKFQNF